MDEAREALEGTRTAPSDLTQPQPAAPSSAARPRRPPAADARRRERGDALRAGACSSNEVLSRFDQLKSQLSDLGDSVANLARPPAARHRAGRRPRARGAPPEPAPTVEQPPVAAAPRPPPASCSSPRAAGLPRAAPSPPRAPPRSSRRRGYEGGFRGPEAPGTPRRRTPSRATTFPATTRSDAAARVRGLPADARGPGDVPRGARRANV